MSDAPADPVVVACAQYDVAIGDLEANIRESERLIRAAVAEHGARLVVLPECATAGYAFASPEEAAATAQDAHEGPTVRAWRALAAELGVWICGGLTERDGDAIYNSAVLVSPDGVAGLYRKVHLWNREQELFSPGDLGFPVVETPFGRVGMMICYDAWFPESARSLALGGADLICAPSNWVPNPSQPADLPTLAEMMIDTAAHSNQLAIAAASRIGTERGVGFIGSSLIAGHLGWTLAGPASTGRTEIVAQELDLVGSREQRRTDPFNRPLHERRADQYRLSPPRE